MARRRLHPSLVFWILVVSPLAGCGGGRAPAGISASGHVEATEVRISTKVAGTLLSFPLEEGDRVAAGSEVARIDTVDTALLLAGARADRGQAAADLKLRLAGSRQEDIAEAEAQVARARADLDGAERDLARMEGLLESGSGTPKARDDARTRRDLAAANLDAAREQSRKRRNGSRPEEIAAARARLDATEARVQQLEQHIRDATVLSPVTGILTEKLAEPGELLPAGAPLCIITDIDRPWLTIYVAEPDLDRVRLGQEATVTTDAGRHRAGRVTFISSQAEFTPKNVQTREERAKLVYKVKIGLENTDGLFKPGMPAEARLSVSQASR